MFTKNKYGNKIANILLSASESTSNSLGLLEKRTSVSDVNLIEVRETMVEAIRKAVIDHLCQCDHSEINDTTIFTVKHALEEFRLVNTDKPYFSDLVLCLCGNDNSISPTIQHSMPVFKYQSARNYIGASTIKQAVSYCVSGKQKETHFVNDLDNLSFLSLKELAGALGDDELNKTIQSEIDTATRAASQLAIEIDANLAAEEVGSIISVASLILSRAADAANHISTVEDINQEDALNYLMSGGESSIETLTDSPYSNLRAAMQEITNRELPRLKQLAKLARENRALKEEIKDYESAHVVR